MLATLSAHDQHEELFEQIARVELLGGHRPVLFRPPYGSFNATTLRELHELHLLMVLWSVDTDDYQQPGVPVIVQRALEGAHPGAIILLHDAGGVRTQTIAALPQIIEGLRARGFHLVTVPQLLKDDPPPGRPADSAQPQRRLSCPLRSVARTARGMRRGSRSRARRRASGKRSLTPPDRALESLVAERLADARSARRRDGDDARAPTRGLVA